MQGIYKIHCNKTGRKYIGSSMDIDQRFYSHKQKLWSDSHSNMRLQDEWNRFGEKHFDFEVVEGMPGAVLSEVVEAEQGWLDNNVRWGEDYNVAKIASNRGVSGYKPAETKMVQPEDYERSLKTENKRLRDKVGELREKVSSTALPGLFALGVGEDRDFWIARRQALLLEVDAIERKFNLSPRTSEARKFWKDNNWKDNKR